MATTSTAHKAPVTIANIDGVLVQCPSGKLDVMGLVRRNKSATTANKNTFIYSNGASNGITNLQMGDDTSFAVLRNNHQRYLIYKPDPRREGRGTGYRTRIVAAIGADGKTLVADHRSGTNDGYSSPAAAAVTNNNGNITPVQYQLCGLTDYALWKSRRVMNVDAGREEAVSNSDDSEDDDEDASDADSTDETEISNNQKRFAPADLSDLVADVAVAPTNAAGNKNSKKANNTNAANRKTAAATALAPMAAAKNTVSGKRPYVQRQTGPKKISPYHVFLRLFMTTNSGQGPSFKDAADTWRGLTKEQQAQYVATPSQFEAVQSQNFQLTQNKDGIMTQEEHLSQQPEQVSAAAIAVGSAQPVDTILTTVTPALSTVGVKSDLRNAKRGRTASSVNVSQQDSVIAASSQADTIPSASQPTPVATQQTEDGGEVPTKKSRGEHKEKKEKKDKADKKSKKE